MVKEFPSVSPARGRENKCKYWSPLEQKAHSDTAIPSVWDSAAVARCFGCHSRMLFTHPRTTLFAECSTRVYPPRSEVATHKSNMLSAFFWLSCLPIGCVCIFLAMELVSRSSVSLCECMSVVPLVHHTTYICLSSARLELVSMDAMLHLHSQKINHHIGTQMNGLHLTMAVR